MADFDLLIIGTGSGNSILTDGIRGLERGDRRARRVRRNLPEPGLHPLEDARGAGKSGGRGRGGSRPGDRVRSPAVALARDPATGSSGGSTRSPAAERTTERASKASRSFRGDAADASTPTLIDGRLHDGRPDRTSVTSDRIVLAAGASRGSRTSPAWSGTPFHTSDSIMRIELGARTPDHPRRRIHRRRDGPCVLRAGLHG